jgi:hypothetical protein
MSRMKAIRVGAVALVATVIAVFAAPAPSMADGDDYYSACFASWVSCQTGTKVSGAIGVCDTVPAAFGATVVCVVYDGDYIYVKDGDSDGHSAMAKIKADNGSVLDRFCRNPHGAGTWARCNFDWAEAGEKRVYGGIRRTYSDMPFSYIYKFTGK